MIIIIVKQFKQDKYKDIKKWKSIQDTKIEFQKIENIFAGENSN